MLIQEAINSGKPFRLPHHDSFIQVKLVEGRGYFFQEVTNTAVGFFASDLLLSDKWEIKVMPPNVVEFKKRTKKALVNVIDN